MTSQPSHPIEALPDIDPAVVLPIVVGASLEAELTDRAVGYRLRDRVLASGLDVVEEGRLVPVVLTDLWYINNQPLRLRPTISVGRPDINAATAYLARKIPTALVVEDAYRIQLDPEYVDAQACLWGTDAEGTAKAVEVFGKRYLTDWLEAAGRA